MASATRPRSQEALQRALDELKNSEKKLRHVIDTIPTLAWCNLPDGSNEFLNKRWHEYTGLSPKSRTVGVGKLRSIPTIERH
jgi:PAS domain-containing protein